MANELARTFPLSSSPAGQGASIDPAHRGNGLDSGSTTANAPDYTCPEYKDMEPFWELCHDVKGGTKTLRDRANIYLPRFEAEAQKDYDARVAMTFVKSRYEQTLEDLVGLVHAEPVKAGDDVPEQVKELLDDFDGEGNSFAVFERELSEKALDGGHAFIYTDYPNAYAEAQRLGRDLTKADAVELRLRPYCVAYRAKDVLSWRFGKFGGVYVLLQVVLRECSTGNVGTYGVGQVERFRVIRQDATFSDAGTITALGPISFDLQERTTDENGGPAFKSVDAGVIRGLTRIPLRCVYGGQKIARYHTRPFLKDLAYTNVEEAQVQSDYAAVMHKCNVPTPIFVGRTPGPDGTMPVVQMGNGIDIPQGGSASMLEPSGAAISDTRQRLVDIQEHLREQGASLHVDSADAKTAKEVQIAARQRNAKLARHAQSLEDATGAALADMASFLGIAAPANGKYTVIVNKDFADGSFDPFFIAAVRDAYDRAAIPLDVYIHALQHGELPDDMDSEETAAIMLAAQKARDDAEAAAASGDTNPDGSPRTDATPGTNTPPRDGSTGAGGAGGPTPPTHVAARQPQPPAGAKNITPPADSGEPAAASASDDDNDAAQDSALLAAVTALSTQVQALAERIDTAERSEPAAAPPPAPSFPPEVLALLVAIAGAIATRPGMPPLKITKNADGSSSVEPQPTPAAAA